MYIARQTPRTSRMMRTLLLVDDHSSFRAIARAVLSEGFDVVGQACDGAEAIALARELRPDVVLLDMNLPDSDGLTVAETLASQADPPLVVLTSTHDRRDFGPLLRRAAAHGFIGKEQISVEALVELLTPDTSHVADRAEQRLAA